MACGEHWELSEPLEGDCRVLHTFHLDGDGDGWGREDEVAQLCGPDAASGYAASNGLDCDDDDPGVGAGMAGASCPGDLVTVASGESTVLAAAAGGFEALVVYGAGVELSPELAAQACVRWSAPGAPASVGVLPGAASEPAEIWAMESGGRAVWTAIRWQGALEGEGLAGSWDGAWRGAWVTPGGAEASSIWPWCGAAPTPAALAPELSPEDPGAGAAWEDALRRGRAVVRPGPEPCLEVQAPGVAVAALACVRPAPVP
jgi:hypothetical protein